MSTIITTVAGLIILAGAYFAMDGNYLYAGICGFILVGGYLFLRPRPVSDSTRMPAASDAAGSEENSPDSSLRPASVAPQQPRDQEVVRPVEVTEDEWAIQIRKIPVVGTSMIQLLLPYEVAFYVPPDISLPAISGQVRVIVGKGQRVRFGPGGWLYVLDCGLKTFQIAHQLQMPVLEREILDTLSQSRESLIVSGSVFDPETQAALDMFSQWRENVPRLSSRAIAQATAGQVTMNSALGVSVNNQDTRANRQALLRLFQQILLTKGQDPVEAIVERAKMAQRDVQARANFTADDILSLRAQEYQEAVRIYLNRSLGPYALEAESYSVLGIVFEPDVQDFRDGFAQSMRELATLMTETATQTDARRLEAETDAVIAITKAEGEAHAMQELMQGEVASLGDYLALLKRRGIKDPTLLQQLLLARVLGPSGTVITQLGGVPAQQPVSTQADMLLISMFNRLGILDQIKELLNQSVEGE